MGADAGGATSSSSDDATSWTGADFLVGPEPPLLPDEFSLSAPGFEKPKAKSVAICGGGAHRRQATAVSVGGANEVRGEPAQLPREIAAIGEELLISALRGALVHTPHGSRRPVAPPVIAQHPLTMPEPWRAETKVYMASERTLINWLRTAATLGLGAAVVNVIGDSTHGGWHSVVVGHAVLGVAMCFFAIYRFWQRHELVRTRHHGTAFGDRVGPLVVGAALIALLAWTAAVLVAQEWEWQFLSEEARRCSPSTRAPAAVRRRALCRAISGAHLRNLDAPHPPRYVHLDARLEAAVDGDHPERGVSGVHRFALATGAPAGDRPAQSMRRRAGWCSATGCSTSPSRRPTPRRAVFGNCSTWRERRRRRTPASQPAAVAALPAPLLGKIRRRTLGCRRSSTRTGWSRWA